MSEADKIFTIAVLAEQGKNLLSVLEESNDVGANAIIFAVAGYLHKIQLEAESLEGGAAG